MYCTEISTIFAPRNQKSHTDSRGANFVCGHRTTSNQTETMTITLANQSLTRIIDNALPALSGSPVTYCKEHSIYLSNGYTSAAGNTYFQGLRLSDRLIVMYEFGQGWAHLFLNGIRLYCFDGKEKKLISSRGYSCQFFNEGFARNECIRMLKNFIATQAKMLGANVQPLQLAEFAETMVKEVFNTPLRRQIA